MNVGKEIARAISGLEFLESIKIAQNGIDSQGALDILDVVKSLNNLKEFDISGNLIDKTTKERIRKELKKLRTDPKVKVSNRVSFIK